MVAEEDSIAGVHADALGAAPARTHVIELSGRAARVHEAITRLQGPAVSWTGRQREIARVSGYKSLHTVSEALDELGECGLLLRQAQGNGRILTYYLRTATPAGEPFLIRTAPQPFTTGRDVVRSAGSHQFTTPGTYAMDDATPPREPMQSPPDRDVPSMSSSSSSSSELLHDAASPAASPGAWVPVSPAEVEADAHLRVLGIDPESDIVKALAMLVGTGEPEADTWRRIALRRTSSPDFVRTCLDTTARKYPESLSAPPYAGIARRTSKPAPSTDALTSTVTAAVVVSMAAGRWAWTRVSGLRRDKR